MKYKLNSLLTSCIDTVTLAQQLLLLQRSVALVAVIVTSISARAIHVYNQENTTHIVCQYFIILPSVNGSLALLSCPFQPLTV